MMIRRTRVDQPLAHQTREIALTALLFAFVYNLEFSLFPVLPGARAVLIILLVWHRQRIVRDGVEYAHRYSVVAWILLGTLLYACVLSLPSGDWSQPSRLFHFLVYSVGGAIAWTAVENRYAQKEQASDRLLRRFAVATGLQSILIFVSLLSFGFRTWVSGMLVRGGNIDLATAIRPPGFSNSGGAALSVVQALGVYAALHVAQSTPSRTERSIMHLLALMGGLATAISGRTGLLMVAFAPILFLLSGTNRSRRIFVGRLTFLIVAVGSFGPTLLTKFRESNRDIDALASSASELFLFGSRTASWQDLASMSIPELTNDTFVGTGRVVAEDINASGHDSGYVQTYFALGVPMTALFYSTVIVLCLATLRNAQASARPLLVWLLSLMMIIELKEPFIFKYTIAFVVLASAWGYRKKALELKHYGSTVPARPS